jgi:arylsulfatase A-like enzyme
MALWHADLEPSKPHVGVSVADLAPTVLHFLGLPMPSNLESQSLFSLDPNLANRATFAEAFPVRGRALFESFRLPALDDAAIEDRLRSIRVSNKGYEPKVAITDDHHRLVHHRSANTAMVYERSSDGAQRRLGTAEGREVSELLRAKLEHWESEQLSRIQCRLGVRANAADPVRR